MLQTVKKGSSLHVVGRSTARIAEAARPGTPRNRRERPQHKARRPIAGVSRCAGAAPATHPDAFRSPGGRRFTPDILCARIRFRHGRAVPSRHPPRDSHPIRARCGPAPPCNRRAGRPHHGYPADIRGTQAAPRETGAAAHDND